MAMTPLTSLKIRELEIKNRVWMSPMCQYSAVDGIAQEWHHVHYGARAAGGVGLIMIEATGILPEARISPGCMGLWNQKQADALKPIVDFVHSQNCKIGIQLAHAGRKASTHVAWLRGKPITKSNGGWDAVAPSPIAFAEGYQIPQELKIGGINKIVEGFINSINLANQVGFDVIELHMAHGYLFNEFLSPLSNHRKDEYGGSEENRMRLPIQVASLARNAWPKSKPLFVRISATDWTDGGWDIKNSIEFVRVLQSIGVDLIDCSSGGLIANAKIPIQPMYQVPFSKKIREETGILTAAVGMITKAEEVNGILNSNQADAIFLARELLRNPYFVYQMAQDLGLEIKFPNQYLRAKP